VLLRHALQRGLSAVHRQVIELQRSVFFVPRPIWSFDLSFFIIAGFVTLSFPAIHSHLLCENSIPS
jgi:hypothetical protein